ncbi:hypothetical protein H4R99_003818 [Coemansia sp. RSA 1722]|nr:hypothetical protein IWW45_001139 [Coemansia sp. RSA 485]KAJ2597939.1 hypothetical protein GGF39_002840 [Coemansia sp. RSA 1721]KAJ2599162.1 hypothetical protein H4R99_003818 [Coemansia sp. RSA 1722]
MDTVVDLTESPEMPTFPPHAGSLAGQPADDPVVVLSDDEGSRENATNIRLPGITNLPTGFILPPLRSHADSERNRPERITTLREVLLPSRRHRLARHAASASNSGNSPRYAPRSVASRNIPSTMTQRPVISDVMQHTGDEPVQPGVYNPIHSRPLLPHERQRHHSHVNRPDSSLGLLPSVAGRETADGAIDVEEVDPTAYSEATAWIQSRNRAASRGLPPNVPRFRSRRMRNGPYGYNYGRGNSDDDDDDEVAQQDESGSVSGEEYGRMMPVGFPSHGHVVFPQSGQQAVDFFFRNMSGSTAEANDSGPRRVHNGPSAISNRTRMHSQRIRDSRELPFFPFHPGLIPHHFRRRGNGRVSPFDFFPGEDLGDLLAFIDANAPAAPSAPPQPPLPPLRLTKQQQELAKSSSYTRAVPDANYRDAPRQETEMPSDAMEIVCTLCENTLFEKEPAWASTCGHVICNSCYVDFAGASKTCSACSKRMVKSKLVHLFS